MNALEYETARTRGHREQTDEYVCDRFRGYVSILVGWIGGL